MEHLFGQSPIEYQDFSCLVLMQNSIKLLLPFCVLTHLKSFSRLI